MKKAVNRRTFIQSLAMGFAKWTPLFGLVGLRFCPYANPTVWRGWIEYGGKAIAFVRTDGSIFWMKF